MRFAGSQARSAEPRAQVALAWTLLNPGVIAPIIGVRTPSQVEDNLGAVEVTLTDEQRARLEQGSAIDLAFSSSPTSS